MPTFNGQRIPDKFVQIDSNGPTLASTKAITAATNATPIVVTSNAHGYSNGDYIYNTGTTGNTAVNGVRIVANKTANTYELTDLAGNNVAGNGTFSAGGTSAKFSANPTFSTRHAWITKVRLNNTTGAPITFNLMDGAAPGTFKYTDVALAADSVSMEIDPDTSTPLYCSGGAAFWASATGVQVVIEGYQSTLALATPAAGFAQPA